MTRTLKALIFANLLGLVAFAFVLSVAPPRVDRSSRPSAFPVAAHTPVFAEAPHGDESL